MQAPVPPLEKAWEFKADSSIKKPGPIAACDMILFGSKDGLIYALDAMSGQVKWTFRMGKSLKLPLSTADGIIFAASEDKNLYAIDDQTGQKRWQFSAGNDFKDWPGPIWFGPIVADGTVYIATKDKKLHAFDVQTGKERWQFAAGGDVSPPAVSRETVFFGSKDKKVYALQAGNGKKIWEVKTDHEKYSSPILTDDKVLIADDDDLYVLDPSNPSNGRILLTVKKVLFYQGLPAVTGGLAFCSKDLDVIDLASGKQMGKIPSLNDFNKVAVDDGTIYAKASPKQTSPMHNADFLFAYDSATRKEIWQACSNTLIRFWEISDGIVFAADMLNNKLIAVNGLKFTKRWESEAFPGGFSEDLGNPVIAYGMVFINRGKVVYAFRSSKSPVSERFLEISPSPKFMVESIRDEIVWPNFCCLCCGPAEGYVDLSGKSQWFTTTYEVKITGAPYCRTCYNKVTSRVGGEKPGVVVGGFPPTYAFRNEKYWAMFMEANRLR